MDWNQLSHQDQNIVISCTKFSSRPVTSCMSQSSITSPLLFKISLMTLMMGQSIPSASSQMTQNWEEWLVDQVGVLPIQRNLEMLGKWAQSCKSCTWKGRTSMHPNRLGDKWLENSCEEKDLEILVDELNVIQQCTLTAWSQSLPHQHHSRAGLQLPTSPACPGIPGLSMTPVPFTGLILTPHQRLMPQLSLSCPTELLPSLCPDKITEK